MPIANWLTKMVAGSATAEKSERKRLEKHYYQVGEDLKKVTDVSYEQPPSHTNQPASIYSAPDPPLCRRPKEGSIRPSSRPLFQRSQTAIENPPVRKYHSPSGPPDISAIDLTEDQLKRAYSNDIVWDSKSDEMPPLPKMKGIGKYRMYAGADAQYQMNHLHRSLSDLNGPLLDHLGDFTIAEVDTNIWQQYRALSDRSGSFTSSKSSQSSSAPQFQEYIDAKTGTRISRGFSPSTISSASSSLKDGFNYPQKASILSLTGSSGDGDPSYFRRGSRHSSFKVGDNGSAGLLSTIKESQVEAVTQAKKTEKPCDFDTVGNNDSAVASDASDEEDGFTWSDVVDANTKAAEPGNLAQAIERKSSRRGSKPQLLRVRTKSDEKGKAKIDAHVALDRSKTVRQAVKPTLRRSHSHKRTTQTHKNGQDITARSKHGVRECKPLEKHSKAQTHESSEIEIMQPERTVGSSEEEKENPGDLGLYMAEMRKKNKATKSKREAESDDGASINSNSTTRTLVPRAVKLVSRFGLPYRRERSSTVVRINSDDALPFAVASEQTAESQNLPKN